ncbi:MAG TPA: response regulator transcription factor [Actinomycetota bacterium]
MIVDDHRLFAEAIQLTLRGIGMDVVDVVTTAGAAAAAVATHEPELVLIDVALPDRNGIEAGAEILRDHADIKMVALTALADPTAVREAIAAGFSGYLTKDTQAEAFVHALQGVLDGQIVVPQRLGRGAVSQNGSNGSSPSSEGLLARQLTPRELEVLQLLAQGAASSEIARRLGVSPNTVRTHVQGILTKLQVHSRLEAAAFAVRHQLVKIGPGA